MPVCPDIYPSSRTRERKRERGTPDILRERIYPDVPIPFIAHDAVVENHPDISVAVYVHSADVTVMQQAHGLEIIVKAIETAVCSHIKVALPVELYRPVVNLKARVGLPHSLVLE